MTNDGYLLLIDDGLHSVTGVERDELWIQTRSEGCNQHLDAFRVDVELGRDRDKAGPKPAGVASSIRGISFEHNSI